MTKKSMQSQESNPITPNEPVFLKLLNSANPDLEYLETLIKQDPNNIKLLDNALKLSELSQKNAIALIIKLKIYDQFIEHLLYSPNLDVAIQAANAIAVFADEYPVPLFKSIYALAKLKPEVASILVEKLHSLESSTLRKILSHSLEAVSSNLIQIFKHLNHKSKTFLEEIFLDKNASIIEKSNAIYLARQLLPQIIVSSEAVQHLLQDPITDLQLSAQNLYQEIKNIEFSKKTSPFDALASINTAKDLSNVLINAKDTELIYLLYSHNADLQLATYQYILDNKIDSPNIYAHILLQLKSNNQSLIDLVLSTITSINTHLPTLINSLEQFLPKASPTQLKKIDELLNEIDEEELIGFVQQALKKNNNTNFIFNHIIPLKPELFKKPLLNLLLFSLTPHIQPEITKILKNWAKKDPDLYKQLEKHFYVEQPNKPPLTIKPSSTKKPKSFNIPEFETKTLTVDEIKPYLNDISDELLIDCLQDGREIVRTNALLTIKEKKSQDPLILQMVTIIAKSPTSDYKQSILAQDTLYEIAQANEAYTLPLMDAAMTSNMSFVQEHALELIHRNNKPSQIIITNFSKNPQQNQTILKKLLLSKYAHLYLPEIMNFTDTKHPPQLIEASLQLLYNIDADLEPIRKNFIKLIDQKSFYNESINRRLAIQFLSKLPSNNETNTFLEKKYYEITNTRVKKLIKKCLEKFEIEVFDDDEEEENLFNF